MKFWEAMKLLKKGKKITRACWDDGEYLCLNECGCVVDEHGFPALRPGLLYLYENQPPLPDWMVYRKTRYVPASEAVEHYYEGGTIVTPNGTELDGREKFQTLTVEPHTRCNWQIIEE